MPEYNLNIVSLDVPYPPNYGGVIDIFYKIKALHALGVNIYLHCFQYGRSESQELEKYCQKVYYYKRETGIFKQFSLLPYIINSRKNAQLERNIQANNYPILFEGLHTIYPILKNNYRKGRLFLRSHNIEHDYYFQLAKRETHPLKKLYYFKEAFLLKKILKKLPPDISIGAISVDDEIYLKDFFKNTFWLPPFHSNEKINYFEGQGHYALYHGNLSVSENIEVAKVLIEQFAHKEIKLIIAGKNPGQELIKASNSIKNITLIPNPDNSTMSSLISKAQVILLPTFQDTGIKLKLIESLYNGRFCIANMSMVKNTRLESLVNMEESDFFKKTLELFSSVYPEKEKEKRIEVLNKYYSNMTNAQLIIDKIWNHGAHQL